MKKFFLFSACLLTFSSSFAQNYQPMALENAHWIMYAIGENGTDHHIYSVKGDTTINGFFYKKTWRQHIVSDATSSVDFQPPFQVYPPELIGAMRDDTLAKQVFYISFTPFYTENDTCDLFDDWLIYDYAINVGDTIGGCLQFNASYPMTALSIGAENLWGQNRTVIDCDGSARLVEGIGTEMGPFWSIFAYPHPAKPSFMYDYCVGEGSECGLQLVNSTRQRLADWQIQLSPNPASDLLTIQLPDLSLWEGLNGQFSLMVADFSGKTVFQKTVESSLPSLQVPVGSLPAGLYLFSLRNENNVVACRFAKL